MSVYLKKGKGWRYDFTLNGKRHTEAWFRTKREALDAEAKRREEVKNPEPVEERPTDMGFLELVNLRLDHVKAYNSDRHYTDHVYLARRWVKMWGELVCDQISPEMIEKFIIGRRSVSNDTANKEIRYLRSLFNFGIKKGLISANPMANIAFLPVQKKIRYVPPVEHIDKVIACADADTQAYLWVIRETMGRVSEINNLTWDDVNLDRKHVVLFTRKKRGGNRTPRTVPMTEKLFEILSRRFSQRDKTKPWVFWQRYWSRKTGCMVEGPYQERKKFMRTLCKKAGVPYFRFHPLRHSGASVMDNENVPIGVIQRILGHENRTTTEIYLHSIGSAERQAMLTYERARANSHTNPHTT